MKLKQLFKKKENWIKGDMENGCGGYCLMGGIQKCYPNKTVEIESKVMDYINKVTRGKYLYVEEYNDAPHRRFHSIRKLVENLDI